MTARNQPRQNDVKIANGGRGAFENRLDEVVRRAVIQVAENANKIIESHKASRNRNAPEVFQNKA
jgi:hypothetical protein